jgi:glycosyltransferase involved in cell wall biosynthesis
LKILHLNSYLQGGAAIAARRLHESLVQRGVDSRFCFASGVPPDATYFPFFTGASATLRRRILANARRWLRILPYLWRRPQSLEIFSDSGWLMPLSFDALPFRPDIVHLHWTADFLDYGSFFASLPAETPVVWTLHDMHPFTGGCHYSFGCEKFTRACGECPQLNGLRAENDLSRQNFELKSTALRNLGVHVAADSRWLEREARRSAIFATARSFRTVHYGLDTASYAPRSKRESRQALGIPQDAFVVCFGSASLADRRKGLAELLAALHMLGDLTDLSCLVFGAGVPRLDPAQRTPIRSTGFLATTAEQAAAYSAADVFVIPSLAEAFGQTALEAMACGTPVIGFDTGGIPDMVRPQVTGLLVPVGDSAGLAAAIRWMHGHRAEGAAMGRSARRMVEAEFTLERQAQDYLRLYRAL